VELWHWGVENLRSDFRQFDHAYLTSSLWPSATMKFNRNALQFIRGLYFMGTRLQDEPWFAEAFAKRIDVNARFNPVDISKAILIPPNQRSGHIDIALTRRSRRFDGVSLSEVTVLSNDAKRTNAHAYWENLPHQVGMERQMHADVKKAKSDWRKEHDESISAAQRRGGIKDNRRNEIEHMTAESTGIASMSGVIAPPQAEVHDPNQVAVQEMADEVERLLSESAGRDAGS
jgi:hypothetical protein